MTYLTLHRLMKRLHQVLIEHATLKHIYVYFIMTISSKKKSKRTTYVLNVYVDNKIVPRVRIELTTFRSL